MTTRARCWIVQALGMIVSVPGIFALVYAQVPTWVFLVVWPTFWFSGMCFVLAMIGDGKEGLGIRRDS